MGFEAVGEFHGAVMLDLQSFGEYSYRRFGRVRESPDCEQSLILLRLNARSAGSLLAQILKAPNFVTKFGERPVIELFVCARFQGQGNYIVRRCKLEEQALRRLGRMCSRIQQAGRAGLHGADRNLETLAEGFLSLDDAVAQLLIETVCGFANHVRS